MVVARTRFGDDLRSRKAYTAEFGTEWIVVDSYVLDLFLWRNATSREPIDHERCIVAGFASRSCNCLEISNKIVHFIRQVFDRLPFENSGLQTGIRIDADF